MTLMIIDQKISAKDQKEEEDELVYCRYCEEVAICSKYTCYKKKQGDYECSSCEERLCKHHWRIYFRRNIR
jgi:hypothetical protein